MEPTDLIKMIREWSEQKTVPLLEILPGPNFSKFCVSATDVFLTFALNQ